MAGVWDEIILPMLVQMPHLPTVLTQPARATLLHLNPVDLPFYHFAHRSTECVLPLRRRSLYRETGNATAAFAAKSTRPSWLSGRNTRSLGGYAVDRTATLSLLLSNRLITSAFRTAVNDVISFPLSTA